MSSQVQDPYWTDTIRFIHETIGADVPLIAPREFRPHFPKIFAYDHVYAVEILLDYRGVAVHKGLMHELPVPVLRTLREEWKCVFANEVFLFFLPPSTPQPAVSGEHLVAFYDNLNSLEKKEIAKKSHSTKATTCVVLASRPPSGLQSVLNSLSLLHLAVVVVPVTGDESLLRAYRDLCLRHRARLEPAGGNRRPTREEVIRAGVSLLLADDQANWIASLDDSVVARPDFLLVMEKWRDAETRPLLGGYWEESDGILDSFHHDGFHCVIPRRPNTRFLYGHRSYWEAREARSHGNRRGAAPGWMSRSSRAPRALVIPGLIIPQAEILSAGAMPPPAG